MLTLKDFNDVRFSMASDIQLLFCDMQTYDKRFDEGMITVNEYVAIMTDYARFITMVD